MAKITVSQDVDSLLTSVDNAEIKTRLGTITDAERTKLGNITGTNTGDQDLSGLQPILAEGAFVDGDKTKLYNIEALADVTDEANVVSALNGATLTDIGAPTSTDRVLIQDASDTNNLKYANFSEFGGGGGDMSASVYDPGGVGADAFDMDNMVAGTTNKLFTTTEETKLAGIEDGATGDQTGAEIKSAYESQADTNAFTDTEKTKLAGIEENADVNTINSDTTNEPAGSDQVLNIVSLTQSEYDAALALNQIVATTFYIIT